MFEKHLWKSDIYLHLYLKCHSSTSVFQKFWWQPVTWFLHKSNLGWKWGWWKTCCYKIHMIHALLMETKELFKKYVRSEGRCYQAKSVLARLGGEGRFNFKCTYTIIFFAYSLQNRNKIRNMSYSDSQNYPFPSSSYS